jgi:hypothetical protein
VKFTESEFADTEPKRHRPKTPRRYLKVNRWAGSIAVPG